MFEQYNHFSILQGLSTGVIVINTREEIVFVNETAESILMKNKAALLGTRCHDSLQMSICGRNCIFQRTLELGISQYLGINCQYMTPDNQTRDLHISSAVVKDSSQKVISIVLFINELENASFNKQDPPTFQIGDFCSCSSAMEKIFAHFKRMASVDTTVLITGETGTGKEVLAKTLHQSGPRNRGPFIAINCGAFPDQLLESELFGYKAGAFTGAIRDKPGRFALANGGTLFLDEIGEISVSMQVSLLRVIQERTYEPLGGIKSEKTDIRIVAATNRNLEEMVQQGKFRNDLFYRINVLHIDIPPLRTRPEDTLLLSEHIIRRLNISMGRNITGLAKSTRQIFLNYSWPGNVRELENVLEQSMVFCSGTQIEPEHLPDKLLKENQTGKDDPVTNATTISQMRKDTEIQAIETALDQCHGNKRLAAELLGIHPSSLYRKLKSIQEDA